jgi:hypothetical protein
VDFASCSKTCLWLDIIFYSKNKISTQRSTTNNNNKRAKKLFSNNFNESFFLIINSFMEKNHLRNSFEKKIIIKILKGIAKLL